jgi:hypothetical protein
MPDIFWIPYGKFSITSHLALEEIQKRLYENLEMEKEAPYIRSLDSSWLEGSEYYEDRFRGWLVGNNFEFRRLWQNENPAPVIIKGAIIDNTHEISIVLRPRLHKLIVAYMVIFVIALFTGSLIPVLVYAASYLAIMIIFNTEAQEAKKHLTILLSETKSQFPTWPQ